MTSSVFDHIAHDYEKIHNQCLPPGVRSDEFVAQKAEKITGWIRARLGKDRFHFLDFGCGNGRLLKTLIDSDALRLFADEDRLRFYGFDPSVESLKEAREIIADERVRLVSSMSDVGTDVRFDMAVSCNVFHHILISQRPRAAGILRRRTKPGALFIIWEHNPLNPVTRALIRICPFDKGARLLRLRSAISLFKGQAFHRVAHAYVHIFPPKWRQFGIVPYIERCMAGVPLGAQYWVMFERSPFERERL
jgi:SAM-dependent methyltransferase